MEGKIKQVKIAEQLHREFKAWCAIHGKSLQEGTEEAIRGIMQEGKHAESKQGHRTAQIEE